MKSSAYVSRRPLTGLASVLAVASVASMAVYHRTAASAADLPLPVPRSRKDYKGWEQRTNPWRIVTATSQQTVVLAQVTSVQAYHTFGLRSGEFSPIISGRCQVIETLCGTPIRGELTIVNPSEEEQQPKPFGWQGPVATRVMRKGELWVLFCNHNHNEVDKFGSFWLTGPTDPMLGIARMSRDYRARRDYDRAAHELTDIIQDPKRTQLERYAAALTLTMVLDTLTPGTADVTQKSEISKKVVTTLLGDGSLPLQIRLQLIHMTAIDLTNELKPDSMDTLQLRALLSMVKHSTDGAVVDEAANRLYFVMVQQPIRNGRNEIYYCPEIVRTLEQRQAADSASGFATYVARTLNNLDLIHRRKAEDLPKTSDVTVIIRKIPPIGNSDLAKRITTATRE